VLSILQQIGHDTLSAATVAEAQSIINESEQKLDLLFTDIELGNHKEGGLTLGKLVEEKRPGMPALYTSGRPATDGIGITIHRTKRLLAKALCRSGFG